jgi:signal transduction histidine kinase
VWLIAKLWRHHDPLSLYILRGAVMLALGAFGTNLIIIYFLLDGRTPPNAYLLPLMAGILVEILFFNNGLSYKSHSTERQLIASQQQLIDELRQKEQLQTNLNNMRQRISRDLHDDLGSALSGMRLIAEAQLARTGNDPSTQKTLLKISGTAKELGSRINEIIWAGNEAKNNAESLLLFVRQYALEYLEEAGIECHCLLPVQIPDHTVSGEKRRHIFLAVKEALHNVVKHAGTRLVRISFEFSQQHLTITIQDDGKGFDPAALKTRGNGLHNMRHRIEHETGGTFQIHSSPEGTIVRLTTSFD